MPEAPEAHVPPLVAELKGVELPVHNVNVPVMTAGVAATVTVTFLRQPEANV
jgi:hypothetical protein